MAPKPQDQPKRWRLRGRSSDGLVVTLGRYGTKAEATADCEKYVTRGGYRDLEVVPVEHVRNSAV